MGGQGRVGNLKRKESQLPQTFPDLHTHGVACIHTQTNKGKNLKATETISKTEVTEMEGIIPLYWAVYKTSPKLTCLRKSHMSEGQL